MLQTKKIVHKFSRIKKMYYKKISAVSALNEYIQFVKILLIAPAIPACRQAWRRSGNNTVFAHNSIPQPLVANKELIADPPPAPPCPASPDRERF